MLTDRDEMRNFIKDLPWMLPTKFRFTWPSGFREELFKLVQSKTRIASGRHVGSGRN